MPDTPIVLYDGTCGFCKIWIDYWRELTGDAVQYATAQDAGSQFPRIPPEDFAKSVQLVMRDGTVLQGARAVFTTLATVPGKQHWLTSYERLPGFAPISETAYHFIATHRNFCYHATRFLWGPRITGASTAFVLPIYEVLLAAIYFVAFWSFSSQVLGLIGSGGIVPLHGLVQAAAHNVGVARFWMAPGLFWLNSSDAFLQGLCYAGAALSLLAILGVARRTIFALLFVCYLSLRSAGQDFMGFQWDVLLLEAGFLAIFLRATPLFTFLMRCLLFRLIFLSGAVKLLSHDPTWRGLTALNYHYFTQPLPTPVAWYMNQLPGWFHRGSTSFVLAVEVLVPFLIFAPRRLRFLAGFLFLFLQIVIMLTGNYTFFNLLTISFCLFLFDDAAILRVWPKLFLPRGRVAKSLSTISRRAIAALATVLIVLNVIQLWTTFGEPLPVPARVALRLSDYFGLVNSYGLFAVMTTHRPEIIVQGSSDGTSWKDFEFRYKPGDLSRGPSFVAPHQPRLDWQMWFAALGNYQNNPWFVNFMVRLLQGSPDVLRLLGTNPFANGPPPAYVRALLYEYKFTDSEERRKTGDWWKRELIGTYLPAISLKDIKQQ